MPHPNQTDDEMLAEIGKLNGSQRAYMRRQFASLYPGVHTVWVSSVGWKTRVEITSGGLRQTYELGPRGKLLARDVAEAA